MSMPPAGNYNIVNAQPTSDGTQLAVTFNGDGSNVNVIELGAQASQQAWTIQESTDGNTQVICLTEATQFRPNPSGSSLVGGTGSSSYAIRGSNDIYTISFGSFTHYWGINEAEVREDVVLGDLTGDIKQNWRLILVSS